MWARIENSIVVEVIDFDPSGKFHESLFFVACDEFVGVNDSYDDGEFTPYSEPDLTLEAAQVELSFLYDAAMLKLQNGYSNEEVKTFEIKQDAIREYTALDESGDQVGAAGLSTENLTYIQTLTGSSDNLVIVAKLDNIVAARTAFRHYSALIEFERNSHIDQLVDGVDNSSVVASLAAAYAAGG